MIVKTGLGIIEFGIVRHDKYFTSKESKEKDLLCSETT